MSDKIMEIFLSYSHKDEVLRDELATHLKILEREGWIRTWHDREITAGQEWAGKIDAHLESADIVLLLVSPDFVASDYCWGLEMTCAMGRHQARTAQVIPVILRPVDWGGAPFGKLQALPRNAQPISTWTNRDEAFLNVVQELRKVIAREPQTPQPVPSLPAVAPVSSIPSQTDHAISSDMETSAQQRPERSEPQYVLPLEENDFKLLAFYQGEEYEFFWTPGGEVHARISKKGRPGLESSVSKSRYVFGRPLQIGFSDDSSTPIVIRLQGSITASSRLGWAKANVAYRLEFAECYEKRLHFDEGYSVRDLLKLFGRNHLHGESTEEKLNFLAEEGAKPQTLTLKLETRHIKRIDDACIPASRCRIEVRLDVRVRDDQGRDSRRRLELVVPLELERLPGLNWLSIDFGTSAIAVAAGNSYKNSFQMIRLQDIKLRDKSSFGIEDRENEERNTPFLPSCVICDADLRSEVPMSEDLMNWPEGYALYHPASLRPGDPSFLGLPALSHQLREEPGRVIFGLKSWLGRSAHSIRLPEKARFQLQGRQVHDSLLPLDEIIESSYAALAEAYLKREPHLKVDQVAICHSNTFTHRHKARILNIARRALMPRFKIVAPHHIHLVSESDAVVYYYCSKRMGEEPRGGRERILLYDLGAGTLDISIIQVGWQKRPFQPRSWTVEARIGISAGGNYVDEILARIIDAQLGKEVVIANPGLEYTFPLVGKKLHGDRRNQWKHRDVVYWIWDRIRAAKRIWNGKGPFVVRVGDTTSVRGPVTFDGWVGGQLSTEPPVASKPAVWKQESSILLSLPPDVIQNDARMLEFAEFVTDTVIEEALLHAGIEESDIDTFLISGRGALWPVVHERLTNRFGRVIRDLFRDGTSMKQAVAEGAIAFQGLLFKAGEYKWSDKAQARLGVLIGNRELVPEEDWGPDRPIDLSCSPTFRVVQVGLRAPDPRYDLKTLRRLFYVDLNERPYRRDALWRKDPKLYIEKIEDGDELTILLRNSDGQEVEAFSDATLPAAQTPFLPWPIGRILLDPE